MAACRCSDNDLIAEMKMEGEPVSWGLWPTSSMRRHNKISMHRYNKISMSKLDVIWSVS